MGLAGSPKPPTDSCSRAARPFSRSRNRGCSSTLTSWALRHSSAEGISEEISSYSGPPRDSEVPGGIVVPTEFCKDNLTL